MRFLLDTNACIAVINGKPAEVEHRLQREMAAASEIYISAICAFELWYGVGRSARREFNRKRLEAFLGGPLTLLPFDGEDAAFAGELRARLEEAGKPAGAYDLLIAGQAVRHQLVLVTANTREFSRIKGLKIENWG